MAACQVQVCREARAHLCHPRVRTQVGHRPRCVHTPRSHGATLGSPRRTRGTRAPTGGRCRPALGTGRGGVPVACHPHRDLLSEASACPRGSMGGARAWRVPSSPGSGAAQAPGSGLRPSPQLRPLAPGIGSSMGSDPRSSQWDGESLGPRPAGLRMGWMMGCGGPSIAVDRAAWAVPPPRKAQEARRWTTPVG